VTNPSPPTPVETFNAILNRLIQAVDGPRMWGLLAMPLGQLIIHRLILLRQHVRRLAESIAAGTYKPRQSSATPRRKTANPRPRSPSPLPTKSGWLLTLVAHETAYRVHVRAHRNHLEQLLQDPEMAALMAAAPDAMRRPLRSLCWMLGIKPPPILARPRRPRQPSAPPTPAPAAKVKAPHPGRSPAVRRKDAQKALSPCGRGSGEGWPREQNVRRTT
jgi:hypothetical protein